MRYRSSLTAYCLLNAVHLDGLSACRKLAAAANTEARKKEPSLPGCFVFINTPVAIQFKLTRYQEICRV